MNLWYLHKSLYLWDFPGKNTRVGCHFLLQRILLTQESNPFLLQCRWILYLLSHQGSPAAQSVKNKKADNMIFCFCFIFSVHAFLSTEKVLVTQSCLTLCNFMDCNPPGSFVHGILQAIILEWNHSILQQIFSIQVLNLGLLIAGRFFYIWATKEAQVLKVLCKNHYIVLGSVLISFFYMELSSFSSTFIEEAIFVPLYILAYFVKNKVPIGAWVYLWAFYLVPWSIFLFLCQHHTILMTVAL